MHEGHLSRPWDCRCVTLGVCIRRDYRLCPGSSDLRLLRSKELKCNGEYTGGNLVTLRAETKGEICDVSQVFL